VIGAWQRNWLPRCVFSTTVVLGQFIACIRIQIEELLGLLNFKSIDSYVTKRHLNWAGHVARTSFDMVPRKLLSPWVTERWPVGAPEFTYGRGLYKVPPKSEHWQKLLVRICWWSKIVGNVGIKDLIIIIVLVHTPRLFYFWRVLILVDLADFIKIRQIKSPPKSRHPPAGRLFRRLDYYSDGWTTILLVRWRFRRLIACCSPWEVP